MDQQKLWVYSLEANDENLFTPILPYSFENRQGGVADSRRGACNGSRPYELDIRMQCYSRGQPPWRRLRRVTVVEAELQRKAAISDARTRAADTLESRRDERGEDYYRQRAQDASDGYASDWKPVLLYSMRYTILYNMLRCYIAFAYNMLYNILMLLAPSFITPPAV